VTTPPPKRPWWRRKRTWAAGAVWLAVAYPVGIGPVSYAAGRGWLPERANHLYLTPYDEAVDFLDWYLHTCYTTGLTHAESASD